MCCDLCAAKSTFRTATNQWVSLIVVTPVHAASYTTLVTIVTTNIRTPIIAVPPLAASTDITETRIVSTETRIVLTSIFRPLKDVCLARCQDAPLFLHSQGGFRCDVSGALKLGVWHGTLCVGCCWVFMMLLFVGGVMNVFSMVAIAMLVLAEKMFRGHFVSRTVGAGLILGGWLLMLPMSTVGLVQTVAAF